MKTLITLKYKRLLPSVSVALLKNLDTGKKFWRHRFMAKKRSGQTMGVGHQDFSDYKFDRFTSVNEFKDYIEELLEKERNDGWGKKK